MPRKEHPENTAAGKAAKAKAVEVDAPSVATTQETVDRINERGLIGIEVDPTPNENYTVAGVLAGLPTPETDAAQAAVVREHLKDVERRIANVGER
jgi:hypothetical protein